MAPKRDESRSPEETAAFVASVLDDMKAQDVRCLDVRHLTSLMDFMVVASGRSDRHVRSIAETLVERCKGSRLPLLGIEGQEAGEWVLVDLADVVVHVMLPRTRAFYEIEKLWDISSPRDDADRNSFGVQ